MGGDRRAIGGVAFPTRRDAGADVLVHEREPAQQRGGLAVNHFRRPAEPVGPEAVAQRPQIEDRYVRQ